MTIQSGFILIKTLSVILNQFNSANDTGLVERAILFIFNVGVWLVIYEERYRK